MKHPITRLATMLILLLAAALARGAGEPAPKPAAKPSEKTAPAAPLTVVAPGDRLAVAIHIATADADTSYTVEPGDELYLNFRYSPALSQVYVKRLLDDEEKRRQDRSIDKISILSRAYVVQPDGNLVLTGIPDPLKVSGMNTRQIARRVEEIYKKTGLLRYPDLNITVDPKFRRYEALRQTVTSPTERPVFYLPVPEDGRIGLPLVSGVRAAGRGVEEIGAELTERFHALGYKLVTVSVWFQELTKREKEKSVSLRVYGEVKRPGLFPVKGSDALDLWDAVALAGGFTPDADVNTVRVIGRDGKAARGPFKFDDYINGADPKANTPLGDGDLILVPRKK